jgi:hypothetical protein
MLGKGRGTTQCKVTLRRGLGQQAIPCWNVGKVMVTGG